MFHTIQAHQYPQNRHLVDAMFRLRKRVFCDQLGWSVTTVGDWEIDDYDSRLPVYLVWTDPTSSRLYGSLRLLPTTGPTLLYDVFRSTFPDDVDLSAPGIWEGTRLCIDCELLATDLPGLAPARAFGLMLLALCETALAHGIETMISNYEPPLKRVYRAAGVMVEELGRADGFGRFPVCCGAFEVSPPVLAEMREALAIGESLLDDPLANLRLAASLGRAGEPGQAGADRATRAA